MSSMNESLSTLLSFYCGDGLQKRDELVVRVLQVATAVCNNSCSDTVGNHRRSDTVGEIALPLTYFSLTDLMGGRADTSISMKTYV